MCYFDFDWIYLQLRLAQEWGRLWRPAAVGVCLPRRLESGYPTQLGRQRSHSSLFGPGGGGGGSQAGRPHFGRARSRLYPSRFLHVKIFLADFEKSKILYITIFWKKAALFFSKSTRFPYFCAVSSSGVSGWFSKFVFPLGIPTFAPLQFF